MQYDLTRYAPAGFPLKQELNLFLWGLGGSLLYSTGFLFRYADAREALYEMTNTGEKVLIENAAMPGITILIRNAFAGFFILSLLALGAAIYHYLFHYHESKSIYLMKRLPNRWELYKRCFALPCLEILLSLLTALTLFLLYYGIYLCFTPKTCLPTGILS